ncbi:hypothetical protein KC19_3G097800 [Ceratodon purpureus]|uniref:Uncharacterized protein n=1 Tax=Ceratodon purpureus TaxID=3225 RepID=A0A8T0IIW8_CERPU|nr:hypothetical protein KC19_3G097800 [Ceratodon purpureus]
MKQESYQTPSRKYLCSTQAGGIFSPNGSPDMRCLCSVSASADSCSCRLSTVN